MNCDVLSGTELCCVVWHWSDLYCPSLWSVMCCLSLWSIVCLYDLWCIVCHCDLGCVVWHCDLGCVVCHFDLGCVVWHCELGCNLCHLSPHNVMCLCPWAIQTVIWSLAPLIVMWCLTCEVLAGILNWNARHSTLILCNLSSLTQHNRSTWRLTLKL